MRSLTADGMVEQKDPFQSRKQDGDKGTRHLEHRVRCNKRVRPLKHHPFREPMVTEKRSQLAGSAMPSEKLDCVFLLCWLPYAIVSFVAAFAGHEIIPSLLATVPPIFAKTQGLASPIILVTRHKAFQRAFIVTFVVGRRRKIRRGGTLTPARMELARKERKMLSKTLEVLSGLGTTMSVIKSVKLYQASTPSRKRWLGLLDPVIYIASNAQMRTVIFGMLPCDGLRKSLLNEGQQNKKEDVDSEQSDIDEDSETVNPKRKGGKSANSGTTSSSGAGKGGNTKTSKANNGNCEKGGSGKKKKGFLGAKKNTVHALAVEPSLDEGVSEVSNLEAPVTVALTPIQTISLPVSADAANQKGKVVGRGEGDREICPPEGEGGAAP
ncbi:rhodopsin [Plakobranchus ocellatus]|uniref:Rhodopsin n=1 Tax=Plakobranchus ocellatus TaxID=259542 RepID=A0AAV4DFA9_9GAST|nr:rhodopsin [Plakobranchus ocellatus]